MSDRKGDGAREARLAAALRANLRRRKAASLPQSPSAPRSAEAAAGGPARDPARDPAGASGEAPAAGGPAPERLAREEKTG